MASYGNKLRPINDIASPPASLRDHPNIYFPLRREGRMFRLHLYAAVQCSYDNLAQWTAGASRHPVFPAPSFN